MHTFYCKSAEDVAGALLRLLEAHGTKTKILAPGGNTVFFCDSDGHSIAKIEVHEDICHEPIQCFTGIPVDDPDKDP